MRERIKYGKRMRTLFEENGRTVWHLIVVTRHIIICKEMNDFFTYSYMINKTRRRNMLAPAFRKKATKYNREERIITCTLSLSLFFFFLTEEEEEEEEEQTRWSRRGEDRPGEEGRRRRCRARRRYRSP